jgi:hypothetical protein
VELINTGTIGTDFNGSLIFFPAPGSFSAGDVVRIFAGQKWSNSGTGDGTVQLQLYLKTGATVAIADTGNLNLLRGGSNVPWVFCALLTIQKLGNSTQGKGFCNGYALGSNAGWVNVTAVAFNIDTTMANTLSLTATVGGAGCTFTLNQASVEYLPSPPSS